MLVNFLCVDQYKSENLLYLFVFFGEYEAYIMIIQFAKNLHNLRSKRASVVPYTFVLDSNSGKYELWILLGVHAKTGEITDLGGGVKQYESDIVAAYREFTEESNNLFTQEVSRVSDLESCISVSRLREDKVIGALKTKVCIEGITTIFLPLDPTHIHTSVSLFNNTKKDDDEISKLLWVRGKDVLQPTSKTYKMWGFIRKFYHEVLSHELLEMLYVSWVSSTRR